MPSEVREIASVLWSETDRFARRRFAAALVFVAAAAILAALAPVLLKYIVDALAERSSTEPIGYVAAIGLIALYVTAQFASRALAELRPLVYGRAEQRLYRQLARRLFAHVLALPMRYHVDRRTGAIGHTLTHGLFGCQLILQHATSTVIPVAIELLTMATVLVSLGEPVFLAILAVSALAYFLVFSRGMAGITEPAEALSSASAEAQALLTDQLLNCEAIKYFNLERIAGDRYSAITADIESQWGCLYRRRTATGLLAAMIFALSLAACLVHAIAGHRDNTLSVGTLVLMTAYLAQIVRPLEMMGLALRDIAQGFAFLQRLFELFREQREPISTTNLPRYSGPGELMLKSVSFAYQPGRFVLHDVSLTIAAGRTTALVGASGSGKSSIVRLILRLFDPQAGLILIDGIPITTLSLATLRNAVGVVPQDTVLFNDTIARNIGLGQPEGTTELIRYAARLARLDQLIATLPAGYDTLVGERGIKMSGGEKQRIAIARAVLKNPKILVFDEATSFLDSRTEQEILANLREISQGHTTLVIAHRLATVVNADEIYVLDRGRVVERGTHTQLLQQRGHYTALWHAQSSTRAA